LTRNAPYKVHPFASNPDHHLVQTAPFSQRISVDFDRIACAHMSGLLRRSHASAGQDGFRDPSS
jgi:hypothetical protein